MTACSNKGESATCTSAAHNAPLSSSRSVRAPLPFSHSLPPRFPRNRLLSCRSRTLFSTLILFVLSMLYTADVTSERNVLLPGVPRKTYRLFFPVALCLPFGCATRSLFSTTTYLLRKIILCLLFNSIQDSANGTLYV